MFNEKGEMNAGRLKDALQTLVKYAAILQENTDPPDWDAAKRNRQRWIDSFEIDLEPWLAAPATVNRLDLVFGWKTVARFSPAVPDERVRFKSLLAPTNRWLARMRDHEVLLFWMSIETREWGLDEV